jgi:methylmalonyl-CoA mutase N-terminal domain/subunit
VIVGVNRYQQAEDAQVELLRIDPALEDKQIRRVRLVREQRNSGEAEAALARLREGAAGDANLMPLIIDCARAAVTMGEMCDALREIWGVWRETPVF